MTVTNGAYVKLNNKFWLIIGVKCFQNQEASFVIIDLNRKQTKYIPVTASIFNESEVIKDLVKNRILEIKNKLCKYTLPSGDQPSLLIE